MSGSRRYRRQAEQTDPPISRGRSHGTQVRLHTSRAGEHEAMSDEKQESPKVPPAQIASFICGIILFGVLMGMRGEFASFWVRALVAGWV
jgi:hypothetical protein